MDEKLSVIRSEGLNKLIQEQRDVRTGKVVSTITREIIDSDQLIIVSFVFIFVILILKSYSLNRIVIKSW